MKSLQNLIGLVLVVLALTTTSFAQTATFSVDGNQETEFLVGDTLVSDSLVLNDGTTEGSVYTLSLDSVIDENTVIIKHLFVFSGNVGHVPGEIDVITECNNIETFQNNDVDVNVSFYVDAHNAYYFETVNINEINSYVFMLLTTFNDAYLNVPDFSLTLTDTDDGTTSISNFGNYNANELKLYPNPCINTLNVETSNYEAPQVVVYDLTGKVLLSEATNSVDMSNFNSGTYLVSVDGVTKKVLKQ